MAIGRLDEDSEGLLLLTTDGMMSEIIRSKKSREKEYYVQVDGIIHQEAIDKLKTGVEIGFNGTKYITKSVKPFDN
jgi:23S rRNA pseudouridine2457 synthase